MASGISKKDESFREFALNGPALKVLLAVCLPLALYQALQSIFSILDTFMASRVSSMAVSSVTVLNLIKATISAVGGGLSTGGSIKIAEAYGKGDYDAVRRHVSTLYTMEIVAGVVIAGILVPFARPFLTLLGLSEEMIREGIGYFRVEILTLVVVFFNNVYIATEKIRGRSRKILCLNMAVIITKLCLSALFIYVLDQGVMMIAVATLCGQLVLLGYAAATMPRDEGAFRFSVRNAEWRKRTVGPMTKLAYPVVAERSLFNAGKAVVSLMAKFYSDLTSGALGISNNIGGLTTGWQSGLEDGAAPLISQNRGAGRYRRTLTLYGWLLGVNIAIGLVGLALVTPSLNWLANIFAQSKNQFDPEFQRMIVAIHHFESFGYVTLGIHAASMALLLGYGRTKSTMIVNVSRVLVRIVTLLLLQRSTLLGYESVGITMMVSNIFVGVCSVLFTIPVIRDIRRKDREQRAIPEGRIPPEDNN